MHTRLHQRRLWELHSPSPNGGVTGESDVGFDADGNQRIGQDVVVIVVGAGQSVGFVIRFEGHPDSIQCRFSAPAQRSDLVAQ